MIYRDLPFDSQLFGVGIARLDQPPRSGADVEELKNSPVDCFYLTCQPSDLDTLQASAWPGVLLADVRMTLRCTVPAGGETLDAAVEGDLEILKSIARLSHSDSRFYFDPHFSRSCSDRLYEIWIEKSCNGWADQVLVPRLDGRPVGYITCHLDTPERGRIGLVAVAEEARDRGFGSRLVRSALAWFSTRGVRQVDVATQGRNVAALRLYEKNGFRMQSVELIFHIWPKG